MSLTNGHFPIFHTLIVGREDLHDLMEILRFDDNSFSLALPLCFRILTVDNKGPGGLTLLSEGLLSVFKKKGPTPLSEEERLKEARGRFISNLSHELRSPLNGITGMIWLLEGTNLNEEQRKYLASLRYSADGLLQLLNDIVDLSRLEIDKLSLKNGEFSPEDIFTAAIESHSLLAEARRLSLKLVIDPTVPKQVRGDSKRWSQVFSSLITVAVKCSAHSELEISVLGHQSDQYNTIQVRIQDKTVGFEQEVIKRITRIYDEVNLTSYHEHGVIGFNLTLFKGLLSILNGKGGIRHLTGKDSYLWFEIPLKNSETK